MSHKSPTASLTASDDEGDDAMQDGATEEEADGKAQWDVVDFVEGLLEFATQAGGGGGDTMKTCSI